ncbi:endopeptidase La [Candidatus Daviesbacteria bacterium]|nr:endopeptidase La [Candidatus Daviesbacteria bacterium]
MAETTESLSSLNEDHYGLEKVKERILEFLAIQKLTEGKGKSNILCFVGPPGTGKTSVGQSIAKALGRKFIRISLGGIRDEAEIRGHRRTYVGALPGRIIQGIRTVGVKNPVFMMDEIDKVGRDFIAGDPQATLLEVLDPSQNNSFTDHYIEIPFDLSEVFFITTANVLDPIPPALKDRMEIIEFSGYTEDEKFHIAKLFLLPRVLSSSGLDGNKLKVADKAIKKIITLYTKEAGVRDLERKLSEIARKVARQVAEGQIKQLLKISEKNLSGYLGPEEYELTLAQQKDEIGVSTGLAWTEAGGDIIFIEARLTPGQGNLSLTGQLGQVMQESAKAALSYVRSKARKLKFDPQFYYKSDIHIHVPSGAIPKDGPSAGVAIAASLASMLTSKAVKKEVALTGEITINGKVLKVGGIKEKILAAHRAGVKTIILPKENKKNLIDVPEEIKKQLKFKFVDHADQIFDDVLVT